MPNVFDTNYKLFNDKLSVHLSRKIFGKYVKCCLEAAKIDEHCPNFDTEDHRYSRQVSNSLDEVKEVCEMLCMSPVLLNSYRRTSLWDKYFNQSSYMKYHIENWYINVIRLEDMFLIMINDIFQLGIKKELVGYEILKSNTNLPTEIVRGLAAFHKSVKPIRAARIMLIHHQTLYEKKLDEIRKDETMVKLVKEGGKAKDFEKELRMIEFFTRKFKAPEYRQNKRDYMLASNNSMMQYVSDMLFALESYYIAKQEELLSKRQ